MIEHAEDVIRLLLWALGGMAALFLVLARWIAQQLLRKLEGIEQAIQTTNKTLGDATSGLRGDLAALERRHDDRIVAVERRVGQLDERCRIFHDKD